MDKKGKVRRQDIRPISEKRKKFAIQYLKNGGNGTQAAKASFPDAAISTQRLLGSVLPRNEKVVNYMRELMDQAGLSDTEIATGIRTVMTAGLSKQSLAKATPREALQAARMAAELRDSFPAQRKEVRKLTINADLEKLELPELLLKLDLLKSEAEKFAKLIKNDELLKNQEVDNYDHEKYDLKS